DTTRLGSLDPTREPYASMLQQANVKVIDLTELQSADAINHDKFASGEVVQAIGERMAEGQRLNDGRGGVADAFGAVTGGAIGLAAGVATQAVSAPAALTDPTRQERAVDSTKEVAPLEQINPAALK
ncbi:MAG: alpha/beta hydrolase, partial [Acetobacteraceae bacterium]|nr:alpha/beta hydrolase [Acetobacteraceae bacterium]